MANSEKVKIEMELDSSKLSKGIDEAVSKVESLNKALKGITDTGKDVTNSLNDTSKTLKDVDKDLGKIKPASDESTRSLENMKKGFDAIAKVGKTMTNTVTLPILGFATASLKTSMDFERAMSEVSAISGATGKDLDRLAEHAKELGRTTEKGARDAAEGMKYFALAGYDTNEILQVMKPTLDLAVLSGLELGQACDIISDNVSALGLDVSETTELVDKMAATTSKSNTTIEMMGEAFKYVAPVANTLGIDVTDLSTAIGLLGDNGIKSSQAGTVLRSGLSKLIKPTKEAQKVMDELGISVQLNSEGKMELMGTVEHLRDRLKNLTRTQKSQVLSTLLGTEALSGWSALISTSQDRVDELSNAIENSNGKASDMAKIMNDNLKGSINNLKSAFEGMLLVVGERIAPVFRKVVDAITEAINKFNNLDEDTQNLIITLAGVTAVIGPLLTAIGGIGGRLLTVIPALKNSNTGMANLLKASTLLKGGLVGLGLAFASLTMYVGSNARQIGELQEKYGGFGTFFSGFGEMLYGIAQFSFGNILILIKTLGKSLGALIKGDFKEFGNIWKDGWAEIGANTREATSNIYMETTGAVKKMRSMTAEELSTIENDFNNCMTIAKQITAENSEEMSKVFLDYISTMSNDSIETLRGASPILAGLLNGITEGLTEKQRMNIFNNNLNSMVRAGKLTLEGFEKDTKNFSSMVAQNIADGGTRIESAGSKVWDNFKDISTRGIKSVSESIASDIKSMDESSYQVISSMGGSWGQLFAGIKDNVSMSTSEMAGIIEQNYKGMEMSSGQVMKALEQDLQLYVESQKLANITLSESNRDMTNGVIDIFNTLSTVTKDNVGDIASTVIDRMENMSTTSVEAVRGMGEGYSMLFNGIKDDGSQKTGELKRIVTENLTNMMNEGLPVGELFKDGMINFLSDMSAQGVEASSSLKSGVSESIKGTGNAVMIELSTLPADVQSKITEAGISAKSGAIQIKDGIVSGVSGTGEAVGASIELSSKIGQEISEAVAVAGGSGQIKSVIQANTAGTGQVAQVNMAGMSTAIGAETSKAVNVARANTNGLVQIIGSNTAGVTNTVRANMVGMYNIINNQTRSATTVAKQNATDLYNGVKTSYAKLLEVSRPNFINLYNVINNQTRNATTVAKQNATNMYNGVKTSFNSMQSQGSSAVNLLKNNVVNATNVMRSTAISNWQAIRSEYGRTITGRIEITKTTRENKVIATVKQDDASRMVRNAFSLDEAEQANREFVVSNLSRLKNDDTLKIIDKLINNGTKKRTITLKDENNNSNNKKGDTYITNNYTSPKQASILELKRMSRREGAKLGASFR